MVLLPEVVAAATAAADAMIWLLSGFDFDSPRSFSKEFQNIQVYHDMLLSAVAIVCRLPTM